MSRTVTALYDTRAEAEAARQRLSSEVSLTSSRIIDRDSHGSGQGAGSLNSVAMSHEDRHAYSEGLRRGGFMLTAEVRGHEDADKIVRLLEESPSVDLDARQEEWRRGGWSPPITESRSAQAAGATGAGSSAGAGQGQAVAEQRIPIVEEEFVVGKREVERGGARVRSYVREVPVHEQVTLREEHVSVERRPVDQRISAAELDEGDLLRERKVEVTAVGEEAVVAKEARLREEVVVRKTADQHFEQVEGSVSRTEVDVENGPRSGADRPAFGGFGDTSDNTKSVAGVKAMDQNNTTDGLGGSNFGGVSGGSGATTGSTGLGGSASAATRPGGSQTADTFRPTGDALGTQHIEAQGFNEARSTYQPASTELVTQRRAASRPSRNLVIGSAVAGAIAGGAIPFMLSGRKSGKAKQVEVDATRAGPSVHADSSSKADRSSSRHRS